MGLPMAVRMAALFETLARNGPATSSDNYSAKVSWGFAWR
jgi:hypothetical protein